MKNRKIFIFMGGLFMAALLGIKLIGLTTLKDFFVRSPLAEIYIQYVRDGKDIDPDHVLTTLDNGMPIIVNKHDRCVCWFVRLVGRWDGSEKRALEKIIEKDFKIIEVGANFGVYTLKMAELVGKNGKIYAFEANPLVSKYLKKSIELNNLTSVINLYEKAAGDKPGEAYLAFGIQNIGGGHLVTQSSTGTVKTEIVCLDDVVQEDHIDLLKIDAEGCEFNILKGAKSLLNKNASHIILMMEWDQSLLKRQGAKIEDFIEFLKSYGFNLWRVGKKNDGEDPLVPITFDELGKIEVADILLSKKRLTH